MEIIKQFQTLIQEFANQTEREYGSQLLAELNKTKNILNQMDILGTPISPSNSNQDEILNDLNDIIGNIRENMRGALDALSLLYVYFMNFRVDQSQFYKIFEFYGQHIFKADKISLFCPSKRICLLGKQYIFDKLIADQAFSFIQNIEFKKDFYARYFNNSQINKLFSLFGDQDLENHIILNFKIEKKVQYYIVFHMKAQNEYLWTYLESNDYLNNFGMLNLIQFFSTWIIFKNDEYIFTDMNRIFSTIDNVLLEVADSYRNYFLCYVIKKFTQKINCNVSLEIEDETLKKTASDFIAPNPNSKKILTIYATNHEFRCTSNFFLKLEEFSKKGHRLWEKFHDLLTKIEDKNFYKLRKNIGDAESDVLILEFNKKGMLTFQNSVIPEQMLPFLEICNFVSIPSTRSYNILLAKNIEFYNRIQENLKEICSSKHSFMLIRDQFQGIEFDLVVKKHKKKQRFIEFSLIIYTCSLNTTPIFRKTSDDGLLNMSDSLSNSKSTKGLKTIIKRKLSFFLNFSKKNTKIVEINEHFKDISQIKASVISEYLPDDDLSDESGQKNFRTLSKRISKAFAIPGVDSINSPNIKRIRKVQSGIFQEIIRFTKDYFVNYEDDRDKLSEWSYNLLEIKSIQEKSRIVWWILNDFNLISEFNINPDILCEFINQMRELYNKRNNYYHNFDHAVTVMHVTYYLLKKITKKFTPLINLSLLIAAFSHDVDHTGHTNAFEVNSESDLALIYHDRAVLEQHHAAVTFRVLAKSNFNIFSNINTNDKKLLRRMIISNILATDMKEHFDMIKIFKNFAQKATMSELKTLGHDEIQNWTEEDIKLVSGYLLHCADLSNGTKQWEIAFEWSYRVSREYSKQVEEEVKLNIPVTPYMKNLSNLEVMAKQEIDFIVFVLKPLWTTLNDYTDGLLNMVVDNMEKNIQGWEDIMKKEKEKSNKKDIKENNDSPIKIINNE